MTDRTSQLIFEATARARMKHPVFGSTDNERACILMEEVGEVCRAINDRKPHDLRPELLDVAAVIVRWMDED